MRFTRYAVVALVLGSSAGKALALSEEETRVIREASTRFLDGTPANNYFVAAAEVLARIQAGKNDYVLVDVRPEKEFKLWHLPGAIGIPATTIAASESLSRLPRDKDIILYCNAGHDSAKVLSILRLLDYRAFGMKFGMLGWHTVPVTPAALKAIADATAGTLPIVQ
jgi:rhodanese-related sulfurtransferase